MTVTNEDCLGAPRNAVPRLVVQSNGVPRDRRFENTGAVETAVSRAVASEENTVTALAKLILASQPANNTADGGAGAGGGDDGEKSLRAIKKHKWLAAIMALVLGPGGMTATYYAIKDRGIANESAVQQLRKDAAVIHPKIEENTKDVQLIKIDISKIERSVMDLKKQNTSIAAGVESLKQVNVDRLEKQNDRLERKIRVLERR